MTLDEWNQKYQPVQVFELRLEGVRNIDLYKKALKGLSLTYNYNMWSVIEGIDGEYLVQGRRGITETIRYIKCEIPNDLDETIKIKYKEYDKINVNG